MRSNPEEVCFHFWVLESPTWGNVLFWKICNWTDRQGWAFCLFVIAVRSRLGCATVTSTAPWSNCNGLQPGLVPAWASAFSQAIWADPCRLRAVIPSVGLGWLTLLWCSVSAWPVSCSGLFLISSSMVRLWQSRVTWGVGQRREEEEPWSFLMGWQVLF